ncbi:hypothetical protein [Segatella maculosa]|uniref:hypothetical protein n=1 Tax=Segatella maculosa TaxID=439703 RepID=UPI0012B63F27|nr:hypothetical protein [Segatella maculosa]
MMLLSAGVKDLEGCNRYVGTHGSCVRSMGITPLNGLFGECSVLSGRTSRASLHANGGFNDVASCWS